MFKNPKITIIITCIVVLISNLSVKAQNFPTNIEWQRCYGWDVWYGDEGSKITPLQDGNFAVIGKKTLNQRETIWASKINSKGEILWETIISDKESFTGFRAIDMIQNTDGTYVLLGKISGYNNLRFSYTIGRDIKSTPQKGNYDVLVAKLNSDGKMIWHKTFGGSGEDIPVKILSTTDNNYLLLTYTGSGDGDIANSGKNTSGFNQDLWLAKLDPTGNILTKKCIGGNNDEIAYDMKSTPDGGFVIVGSSNSNDAEINPNKGGKDVLAIKIDASNNVIWKKTFGGDQKEEARKVLIEPNGDIVLGISSNSATNDFLFTPSSDFPNNFEENIWLLKLNAAGVLQNKKIFGGSSRDIINDLILTKDGNYTLIGSTKSNNGNIQDRNRIPANNNDKYDLVLIKTSKNLDFIAEKTIGGSEDDEGNGIVETIGGGYIAIGTTQSFNGDIAGNHYSSQDSRDILLIKLNIICETNIITSKNLSVTNLEVTASQTINTSDKISQNSSLRYGAGKSIDITPGFNSDLGSTIEFDLNGCTSIITNSTNPIQIKVNNECREGGMKFEFMPFTPNTNISEYRMSIQSLSPEIEYRFSGNTLITKNNLPDNGNANFILRVAKDGYNDFVYQGYTSTCEHDNAPINCPENDNNVILDKDYYNVGETFTATWTGTLLPTQTLNWYNEHVADVSRTEKSFTGRITEFPAHIQAQPSSLPDGSRPCHGATRVEFRNK
jgi:hypothetical protein